MDKPPIEQRVRPCRECIYYLFVLSFIIGGAVLRQMNLLIAMAALMVGLLLLNWRFVVAMLSRMKFRRVLPERVAAGDAFTVEIIAENQRERLDSWAVVVRDNVHLDDAPEGQTDTQVEMLLSHIAAGSSLGSAYRCRFTQRGRYCFGPLVASTRFPLGLIRARQTIRKTDPVIVYPALGQLKPAWTNRMAEMTQSQQASCARGRVDGDYFGLRDWRSGDDQRWVHWRATAKLGSLTVCEYEQQRSQQLALMVDLWLPPEADHQHRDQYRQRVEVAVNFAATAIADVCRGGNQRMALAVAGHEHQYVCAPTSMPLLNDALDFLATIRGGDTDRALATLVPQILRDAGSTTRLMVISTRAMRADQLAQQIASTSGADVRSKLSHLSWIDVGGPELPRWFELSQKKAGALT